MMIRWLNIMAHEYALTLGWFPSFAEQGTVWFRRGYMRIVETRTPALGAFWCDYRYWHYVLRRALWR